jgi:sterol 24-C-methyltransferase
MSYVGKNISSSAIWVMEKLRMMPAGTYDMKTAGDAIVRGGQTKLFTPMMLFVAKKVR